MTLLAPTIETDVVVVGAGPAGLTLAVELGRRGVAVVVADSLPRGAYKSPRTMLINARSMEHLRRWGIADKLRADNPIDVELVPDVLFATTLNGYPLHRFERPFVGCETDPRLAERAEWIPQWRIEATIREHAESLPSVRFLWGHELTSLQDEGSHVIATLRADDGESVQVRAQYLAGCDGSHSLVRRQVGVRLEGQPNILSALKYHVVAPLKSVARAGLASFYWFVNGSFDAGASVILNALDAADGWGFACYPVPEEIDDQDSASVKDLLIAAIGEPVPIRFVSGGRWTMHALVAPQFRVDRVFLVGDAAHLMPNLGGFGMNSSLLDAVDLGWKLAARLAGWGGERLLDSYDGERRRSVAWVISQQVANASVLSGDLYRPGLESPGEVGVAARTAVGHAIANRKRAEFDSIGMQKGYRYDQSPIIVPEQTPPPAPDPVVYVPSPTPGGVAPHEWLAPNVSLYDQFGPEYTLLRLGESDPEPLARAFASSGAPLAVATIARASLRAAYGADLVLIRPDQHIAWRGGQAPPDPERVMTMVTGR
jgi:2-polyprenyl-6-methoxyphenol hydroxylase-like FAD-dependent oxidoreductase